MDWAELRRRLYAVAMQLTGNPADAEDIAQEACLRIHQKLNPFRGEGHIFTWAYRIAVNIYRDQCRKARRKLMVSWEQMEKLVLCPDFTERLACINLIGELPRWQRKVFLLREYYGYSYEEIARLTRLSIDSVKARLYRARKYLENRHY